MPENLHDADTGGQSLIFPDDAEGVRFRLRRTELYSADEVRDEIGQDTPEYGRWLMAEIEGETGFFLCPGEMIEELQDLEVESGQVLEVTRMEKSGGDETDPYEVNVERHSTDTQTRL